MNSGNYECNGNFATIDVQSELQFLTVTTWRDANGAKEVLVTSLTQMNHNYIVIVLNSDDRFGDTVELIKKVIPNIRYKEITF